MTTLVTTPTPQLEPRFDDVQHHYDLSDDFYRLFLDPTQTYSCAYFERDEMTLEEAQIAKIDLALDKLGLEPGMTLLDIGCGWGATLLRALRRYDVDVVGLTLSRNQAAYVQHLFERDDSPRSKKVVLDGWESFGDPVDRIVSIGAFEHFGHDRYSRFFEMASNSLPAHGIMVLHTIVLPTAEDYAERALRITIRHVRFMKFIQREIFPGGELPRPTDVTGLAARAGFTVTRVQPLRMHYARTLECWSEALEANRERALQIQSEEVYDRYHTYLTGCAELFRDGYIDVCQFTLSKGG